MISIASKRPIVSALLLASLVIGLAACEKPSRSANSAEGDAQKKDKIAAVPVEITQTRRGDIYAAYSGTATLEAFDEAKVVAKVEGEVASIAVEEGDQVRAGQILARLDGDRMRLRLEQARANLAKAEREYNRNINLHEKGLVAAGAFESIKFDMDSLRAAFNIAKLEYSYTTIKAPIDGVIADRAIKVGNTITTNSPVFHIVNLRPLVAYLYVPEREFGKLQAGQLVSVTVDAIADKRYRGTVARISPMIDSNSGTFKATIELNPEDLALKPGMFARLGIVYDTREQALLVPREAVVETELGPAVFVIEDGTAKRRPISPGFDWQHDIEVVDGLEEGESIVILGLATLKDGAKVEVIDDQQSLEIDLSAAN